MPIHVAPHLFHFEEGMLLTDEQDGYPEQQMIGISIAPTNQSST